jgi:3-methyladenine DNA glycosylase Tag
MGELIQVMIDSITPNDITINNLVNIDIKGQIRANYVFSRIEKRSFPAILKVNSPFFISGKQGGMFMGGFEKIRPQSLADYLEIMSKSVFQSGISWRVVDAKWAGIKEAFRGFDPEAVSKLTVPEIDRLAQDASIIRNRRKIEAIVENARRLLELDKLHGGFPKYLRSFASFEELTRDLCKQFKFVGEMGAYHFLWVVGEKVPSWDEWSSHRLAKV